MSSSTEREGPPRLAVPSAEDLLAGVTSLAREFHLELGERALIERFLDVVRGLFPERLLLVRAVDGRSAEPVRVYGDVERARPRLERERLSIKPSSVEKTRMKTAVAESARLRVSERWDSPFPGAACGFAVPLVAAGELYGVLDVAYAAEPASDDEPLLLPLCNQLSLALRNERLHRDTTSLRDYQTKLIEHANALILGIDRSWRVVVCNQALCRLVGYRREELVGRDVRDHFPATQRAQLSLLFRQALAGEASAPVEMELLTRAGDRVRTVWSVALIRRRGEAESVVAVGQDQTRLRDLQSQVIHAEKLATLGQLAAGVVHELNNPLTSITVYAEYLLRKREARLASAAADPDAADESEKLRRIAAGARRIQDFARDLVQYAKPAGDRAALVSLAAVVRQSLSFCEHLFERSEVQLVAELPADLPPIEAVPGQLEQVVINLVTNAVHACAGAGEVRVHAGAERGAVVVRVADTGPGIPAADRERIFEPFYTTKSDGQGTGLGLSIVKNIVEQHGGQVSVHSAPGGGAEFRFSLPVQGRAVTHDG